jgi:hypothetical protein
MEYSLLLDIVLLDGLFVDPVLAVVQRVGSHDRRGPCTALYGHRNVWPSDGSQHQDCTFERCKPRFSRNEILQSPGCVRALRRTWRAGREHRDAALGEA